MNFDSFNLDLDLLGAPGFKLKERIDLSGHSSGKIDPHINVEIINPDNEILRKTGPSADFRDLTNNQLPGFNGMQVQEVTLPPSYGDSW
jgi:hypothetical protein